jgi:acyl carrier protein
MENINSRILDILEQKMGIDKQKLQQNSSFQELGFDEIDRIMLTVCLEDAFEIMIDDEQFAEVKTLPALTSFIGEALRLHSLAHPELG